MRSDLSDEKNHMHTVSAEVADSSDTSGFYELTNNVNGSNQIYQHQMQNDEHEDLTRPKRAASRRTQVSA
jgi:hypothetical protein